ncbi:MAG TPA: hypothetical protein VL688_10170 [Verrucomicrobiae bacterium]|nr:hypothetical protein [Verrucomicrobiae bacterium]
MMVEGALANALAGHAELRVDLLPAAREIKPRAARAKAAAPAAQAPARAEMRPSWEANDLVRSTLAERNKQRAQLLFDFLFEHPLGKTGVVHFQSEQGTAAVFDFAGVEKTPQGQWRVRANRISWMSINEAQQGRTLTSSEFSRFGVALLAALDRQSPDTASKTQIRELLDRLWQLDQKVIQDLTAKKAEFEPQAQATIERNLLTYERARIESQTLVNWALLEPADAPPGFADTDSSGNLVFYPRVEIADSLSTYTGDMGALLSGSSPVRRSVLAAAAAWEKRLTGGAAQAPVPELAEAGTRRIVQDTHAFLNRYFAHFQETLARGARQTKTPLPTAEAFAALTIEQKVGLITTLRAADLERLRQLQQSLDNRLQKIHEGAENLLIIDESVAASVREDRRLEERAYYRPDPGGIFLLPLDPAKDPIPEGAFERPEYPGVLFARFSAYTPEAGDPNVAVVEEHRKQTLALEEKARKRGRELDVLSRSYKTAAAEIKNERARYDLDLAFLEMTPEPVPESPQARAVAAQEAKPAEAKPRGFMGRFLKIFAPLLLLAGLGVGLAVYYFSSPPQEPPAAEQKQEKEKEKKVNERKEEEKAQEPPPPEQNREAEKPKPPEVMPRAQPLHIQEPWSQYTPGVVGGDETSKGLGKKDPNARPVYYFTYSGDAPPHYFFVHQVFKVDPNNPSRWIAVPRNELPELTYKGSGRSSKMTMHVPLPASAEEPTKGLPLPIDARQAGQKPAKDKQVDVEFQLNGRYEGAGQQKGPGFIPVGQAKHLDQVRAKYGLPERDSLRNATPEQLDAAFREIFNRHFKYSSAKASKDYWNAPGAHEKLMETALPAADRFVPGCECSTLSHILGYFLAYYGYHYEILGGYVDADRNGVIGPKEGHAIIRVWMVDPETGAGYYHYMDPVQWVSNTDRWQRELAAAATGDSDIKLFTDYLLENRVAPAVYSFSFLVLAVLGAIVALVLFPYKRYRGLVKLFVKSGYEEGAPGIYNGRVTDAYWKFKYAYGPYKAAVLEHHRKLAESDAAHPVPSEKEIEGWFGQHAAVAVVRAQRAVQGPMAAELPNAPEDGMNLRFVFDGTTLKSVANETGSAEERNQPRKAASGFRHLVRETLRTLRGVLTSGYTWAAARLILLYPLLGTLMFSIAGETLSNLHTALVMLTLPFVMTLDYLWFSHRWFSDDRRDYDTLSWIGAFIGNFLAVTVAAILGTAVVGVSLDGVWSLLGQDKQNELQFFATQNWLSLISTSIKSWAVTIAGFFAAIAIAVAGTYALREYLFRTRYRDYFMRHSFEINPRLLTYSAKFAFTKGIPKGPEVSYGDDAYYTRLANFLAKEPAEGLREYKDPKRLEKDVKYITYAMPLPGNGKYYLHVPEALIKLYPEFPVHAMASIRQSQSPPADGDHEIYYFSRDVKEISKYSGNMKIDGRAVSTTSINPLIASPLGMANTKKPQIAAAVKFLLLVHATNLNGYQAEDGQLFLQNADRLARANPQILRDLGFPETGDLKTQLQEILTLAGRSGLFRLSTLADMPVDKLRERMELASQPFRVIIEPVRRLTLEEVRQYAALRITGYRRGDFEQYGTERKTEILRQIFPLFALEADDGVAFPEAIEVVAEDDPTDIVRVRYADVKGFEKYAPKTPAPAPAALPQPEAPRFSASEEQHHAELRLADTPVPAESLQVMAAGIAPADLKGPLAAVLPQGTTAEHAAEVSFEVLSERNTADVGRQLKESVFAAFLASRETPGPVSTIDAKTARAESAKLLATLASLTHKGYTLGMIPPSESEAAGKKSYFETLIQIARDYGVNEIGTDWKKVPADVYEKLRALGVNPRHLDPRRPFVPLNDQELVPLLVVTQLLEGLDFSKFFMPIRGDVSGIQDPLVVDYTELLKLVAALHLIDLVAADPALLKKPAELQAQLLGRLQLFDQRFQGVITGDADGWGFTVQGKIAQAYLEAMAREAVKQAA